ncbi:hypothetical protein, partial [Klebsiella pneumoniae]|uniref:hypothetical protein n=1 Tax=Klebsiella pneumoniae TaxID=573 RepID=UPI001953657D
VVTAEQFATMPLIEPVYPMTEGLGSALIRRAGDAALARLPRLPEWQDRHLMDRRAWPDFGTALRTVHAPREPEDFAPEGPAWSR